jgi:hypothetical protein
MVKRRPAQRYARLDQQRDGRKAEPSGTLAARPVASDKPHRAMMYMMGALVEIGVGIAF